MKGWIWLDPNSKADFVGPSPLAAGLQERTHGCRADDAGNGSATDADVTCWQHVARRELGSQGKQGLEV